MFSSQINDNSRCFVVNDTIMPFSYLTSSRGLCFCFPPPNICWGKRLLSCSFSRRTGRLCIWEPKKTPHFVGVGKVTGKKKKKGKEGKDLFAYRLPPPQTALLPAKNRQKAKRENRKERKRSNNYGSLTPKSTSVFNDSVKGHRHTPNPTAPVTSRK